MSLTCTGNCCRFGGAWTWHTGEYSELCSGLTGAAEPDKGIRLWWSMRGTAAWATELSPALPGMGTARDTTYEAGEGVSV